jgi:hypothetical protein
MKHVVLILVILGLVAVPAAKTSVNRPEAQTALSSVAVLSKPAAVPASLQADAPAQASHTAAGGKSASISLASASLPVKIVLALLCGLIALLAFMPFIVEGGDGYPEA